MKIVKFNFFIFLVFSYLSSYSQPVNYLQECWNKQVKPLNNQYLKLYFHENLNELVYNQEPWHTTKNIIDGMALVNAGDFIKIDSLKKDKLKYSSKLQLDRFSVLYIDYGEYKLSGSTINDFFEQFNKTARYSPIRFIDFFYTHNPKLSPESNNKKAVYSMYVGDSNVKIWINKTNFLVEKIVILSDDDFLCDIQTSISYTNYKNDKDLYFPYNASISKYNERIKDEVTVTSSSISPDKIELIPKPENYALSPNPPFTSEIVIEKYNSNINIGKMIHTDVKSLIIEFKDFFLITDAPINTKYGSVLIGEAKRIAPNKPIKYYAFGHRDPLFLGGVRAFINEGSNILCTKNDIPFIKYLANAPRKTKPDILQINPKEPIIVEIKDTKTISDGDYEMKLYYIGNKPDLQNDYIIYYFPTEKLIFEDDLVWISNKNETNTAGKRQTSLYNAIKELGLAVDTIIQSYPSYPSRDFEYKTKFTFKELEESVLAKVKTN